MSIEISPAPTANPKPVDHPDNRAAKAKAADGKSKTADAKAGAAEGGFMAILGSLGDAAADTATGAAKPERISIDALATDPNAAPTLDVGMLLQHNPQIAAAQAAAQARAAGAATAGGAAGQGGSTASLASTALAGGADAQQDGLDASTLGLQKASVLAKSAKDMQTGTDAAAGASGTGSGSVAAANERADTGKLLLALEQAQAPQPEKTLEPLFAPLLGKPEKSEKERNGFSFKSAEPTYSGSTLGSSAPDFSQSGAPAPVMAPEMQVAEQVSYWVSHNVQNAELSLDGLGQSPVAVSISVQGNEAQISFRSDEAATRSLLESAGSHLRDLLQREGLSLAGVSVGSSGSGDSGGSERRGRPNVRQGVIAPLQVASAGSGPRLRTDAGRSVDLFV